jgi:hypothetical protein
MSPSDKKECMLLKADCEAALDDLTAALTMVLKAANRANRAIAKFETLGQSSTADTCSDQPISASVN